MTIVFFTAGTSGVGRFAVGCSLGTALRRTGIAHDYTMVSAHGFAHLADALELNHIEVPFEDPQDLSAGAVEDSQLYRSIAAIQPDVLVGGQAISLDEKVARWARLKAAENDTSVSRLLADQLEQQMVRDSEYERARVQSRQQRSGEARHRI